ncbi:type II secretion system minor pseudopilin GspK [Aurantivibrio infirmus]
MLILKAKRKNEHGAALVLAILIVGIVTALAVKFSLSFILNSTRAENRLYGSQAQSYLLGAEILAGVILEQDAEESATDNLSEVWAQDAPPFPTDDGLLEAKLEDALGRLNLNSLDGSVGANSNPNNIPALRFTPQQRRFIRLLQIFEEPALTEDEAIEITEAVIDWIDKDDDASGFGGAESLFYSGEEPPYQAANAPFSSVSELRLVRHMTPELYQQLEPLLVALPENTDLNVNTALPALLRTLNNPTSLLPLEEEEIESLLEDRELQQYETVNDFFNNPLVQTLAPDLEPAGFGVESNYFILHAKASVGDQERFLQSYLFRDDKKLRTLRRRYTSY